MKKRKTSKPEKKWVFMNELNMFCFDCFHQLRMLCGDSYPGIAIEDWGKIVFTEPMGKREKTNMLLE